MLAHGQERTSFDTSSTRDGNQQEMRETQNLEVNQCPRSTLNRTLSLYYHNEHLQGLSLLYSGAGASPKTVDQLQGH